MKKDKKFNKSNPSIKNEKTKPYMKPSLVEEKKNKAPEQPKVTISEKVQNLPVCLHGLFYCFDYLF